MFFSRSLIDSYFDVNSIQKFYDLLSPQIEGLELIWKSDRDIVDASMANSAKIEVNGSTLFSQNTANGKGVLKLSLVEGMELEIVKAADEAGLITGPHEFGMPVACSLLFIFILGILCFIRPELASVLIVIALVLFTGIGLYAAALFKNMGKILVNISSVLIIIGLLPMAPSSLLLFPLILAINRQNLYRLAVKAEESNITAKI